MRARRIEPAHGRAAEQKGRQQLQWYEKGEVGELSTHEKIALTLLAQGHTIATAAKARDRAYSTIRIQVNSAMKKLDAKTATEAVAIAIREGLIFTDRKNVIPNLNLIEKLSLKLDSFALQLSEFAVAIRRLEEFVKLTGNDKIDEAGLEDLDT